MGANIQVAGKLVVTCPCNESACSSSSSDAPNCVSARGLQRENGCGCARVIAKRWLGENCARGREMESTGGQDEI
jgi:hypothetical protein